MSSQSHLSSFSKIARTVTCLPSTQHYQDASVGRVISPCFFSPLRCNDRRGCPVAAIFRAHDWTKSSLEWSRGIEAASGCMPREEDRRKGRCSLRSLTPRYNRAGCTGKIMAVNLWTDSIGFHLSSFLVAAFHRDISFTFLLFTGSPTRCVVVFSPCLSFCLRQESQNRYIIAHDLHPTIFPANIYAASTDIKWW